MIRQEDDGVWVILRETISCHHEEVFACLTTDVGLCRWFPVAATIDLRTGGDGSSSPPTASSPISDRVMSHGMRISAF